MSSQIVRELTPELADKIISARNIRIAKINSRNRNKSNKRFTEDMDRYE